MIMFLYILWIAYTVGTLSLILFLVSLSYIGNKQRQKQRKKIAELMGAHEPKSHSYFDESC